MRLLKTSQTNSNTKTSEILTMIFIIAGLVEGIWGVLQIFGVIASGHTRFLVTGSFYNPGPYGCFLALIIPTAIYAYINYINRGIKFLCLIYFIICLFILPGGLSRSAWLSSIIGGTITILLHFWVKTTREQRRMIIFSLVLILLIATATVYWFKQDSADGRFLIWKIAYRILDKFPLTGVGWQNVAGTYGEAQEAYFSSGAGTAREIYLADSPSFIYNEYLQVAIAFGVPSLILMLVALSLSYLMFVRHGLYGFAGSIIAFSVCCLSSYPLQFWEFKIAISILLIYAFAIPDKQSARYIGLVLMSASCAVFSFKTKPYDVDKEYERARKYSMIDQPKKSNRLLKPLLDKCSNAELLLLMGNNYKALGLRDSSAHYYNRAASRIPNRMYPHYCLMNLWLAEPLDSIKAIKEAEFIVAMRPKVQTSATIQMKQEARQLLRTRY